MATLEQQFKADKKWAVIGDKQRRAKQHMATLEQQFKADKKWAVIGASTDESKFGNKILRRLRDKGYDVVGINPHGGVVDGFPLVESLDKLAESGADLSAYVLDFVVPPKVTEATIKDAHRLGARKVWLQPGSESAEAVQWATEHDMQVVQDCILHQLGGH
eukprot:TRINITY_DN17367_c0_g1_i1.p1 TRINITY_DN17367_c0_g1~~TRINITY_DN17367_c0_g1_i1.p1  ORF type:complete len:177 (+),score=56.32 TRINITY_DN17367_c0_g1_i1:50-532(+)